MDGKWTILTYQLQYENLTKKVYEQNPLLYARAIICLRFKELKEHYSYMVKQGKPRKSGTKITFKPIETEEDVDREFDRLVNDANACGLGLVME